MMLDGEIVALDAGGRPSFNALQKRAQLKSAAEIAAAQRDRAGGAGVLRPAAFCRAESARRQPTATVTATSRSACCQRRTCSWYTPPANAEQLYAAALRAGFEGIVAKRLDSRLHSPGSARAPG